MPTSCATVQGGQSHADSPTFGLTNTLPLDFARKEPANTSRQASKKASKQARERGSARFSMCSRLRFKADRSVAKVSDSARFSGRHVLEAAVKGGQIGGKGQRLKVKPSIANALIAKVRLGPDAGPLVVASAAAAIVGRVAEVPCPCPVTGTTSCCMVAISRRRIPGVVQGIKDDQNCRLGLGKFVHPRLAVVSSHGRAHCAAITRRPMTHGPTRTETGPDPWPKQTAATGRQGIAALPPIVCLRLGGEEQVQASSAGAQLVALLFASGEGLGNMGLHVTTTGNSHHGHGNSPHPHTS